MPGEPVWVRAVEGSGLWHFTRWAFGGGILAPVCGRSSPMWIPWREGFVPPETQSQFCRAYLEWSWRKDIRGEEQPAAAALQMAMVMAVA